MDAVLVKNNDNTQDNEPSLRLSDDVKRGYSKTPTAHLRDMQSDGISATAQRVYIAIAQRQKGGRGECFRSNAGLGDELGLNKRTISRAIQELKTNDYLSVWFVYGNRRMRVLIPESGKGWTPVSRGVDSGDAGGRHERLPDKSLVINQEQQTQSLSFSSEQIERFGLGFLEGLVAAHDSDRVMGGLQAYEKADKTKIRNSKAWLTDACKKEYKPSNSQKPKKFPECTLEHENIIKAYQSKSKDNADEIFKLFSAIEQKHGYLDSGEVSRIAHRIWRSENEQSN